MRLLTKIVTIIIVILTIMHYRKYKAYAPDYEIQQQELDYIDGSNLYNQLNPLIITFIEDKSLLENVNAYKLYSPLSVSIKSPIYNTDNDYLSHSGEILFIRVKSDITLELINPKYTPKYKNIKSKDKLFSHYSLPISQNSNVKAIDIILHEYNIIFIPRHWLFKFADPGISVELYSSHNIYTYLFNILH